MGLAINPAVYTVTKHTHTHMSAHRITHVKVHFCLCITSRHNAPRMMPASGIILKPNVSFNLDEFFPTASAALLFLFFSPPDWEKSSAVT